jgi:gamma-glutamyltranspeptidase/glutathione hydrolase
MGWPCQVGLESCRLRFIWPAIGYAKNGFIVTPVIAELWRRAAADLAIIQDLQKRFCQMARPQSRRTVRECALAKTFN